MLYQQNMIGLLTQGIPKKNGMVATNMDFYWTQNTFFVYLWKTRYVDYIGLYGGRNLKTIQEYNTLPY